MKRIFTFTFLVLMLLGYSHAQGYSTGIGMRGGYTYGLTVKHFFTSDRAVEGIIGGGFSEFEDRWPVRDTCQCL